MERAETWRVNKVCGGLLLANLIGAPVVSRTVTSGLGISKGCGALLFAMSVGASDILDIHCESNELKEAANLLEDRESARI